MNLAAKQGKVIIGQPQSPKAVGAGVVQSDQSHNPKALGADNVQSGYLGPAYARRSQKQSLDCLTFRCLHTIESTSIRDWPRCKKRDLMVLKNCLP